MATPKFVQDLRSHVGQRELWLPGVSAVVIRRPPDDDPEILLVRRSDDSQWTVTSGILEPGEDPAPAGVREIEEETGIVARPVRLAGVWAMPPIEYPNGDRCRFLDTVLEMEWVSGEPRVNDDESSEVGWFSVRELPESLSETQHRKIGWALHADAPAKFVT